MFLVELSCVHLPLQIQGKDQESSAPIETETPVVEEKPPEPVSKQFTSEDVQIPWSEWMLFYTIVSIIPARSWWPVNNQPYYRQPNGWYNEHHSLQ